MTHGNTEGGDSSVDREGLREVLGYGALATRLVNLLIGAGISTPSELRKATYGDLLDIPGVAQKSLDHIVTSLEYVDRTRGERR